MYGILKVLWLVWQLVMETISKAVVFIWKFIVFALLIFFKYIKEGLRKGILIEYTHVHAYTQHTPTYFIPQYNKPCVNVGHDKCFHTVFSLEWIMVCLA